MIFQSTLVEKDMNANRVAESAIDQIRAVIHATHQLKLSEFVPPVL